MRSGREHWAWMVVVEVRQGTLRSDRREEEKTRRRRRTRRTRDEEEKATNKKSNNPHLAGGEKH